MVVIPPSGGKTRTWTSLVANMAVDDEWMPSVAALLPTRWHVRQSLADIARAHPGLRVGHQASGLGKGPGKSRARAVEPLTLFTYRSFAKWVRSGWIEPDDLDMLVLDDAHAGLERGLGGWLAPFLRSVPTAAFVPTPGLDGGGPPACLGPDAPVHEASSQELRIRGDIAPVVNYVLAVDVANAGPDDRQAMRAAMAEAALDFLASEPDLAAAVRERATLFHAPFVDDARAFAEGFNARFARVGRRMELLTSDDGDDRIRSVLKSAATGRVAGVASAKLVAIDGIHLPDVGVVVNAATESSMLSLQRSGRVQAVPDGATARTGYVVDAFLRIDGAVDGRPRFFHEVAPNVVAKLVVADPVDLAARGADPGPAVPPDAASAIAPAGADAAEAPSTYAERAGTRAAAAAPIDGSPHDPAEAEHGPRAADGPARPWNPGLASRPGTRTRPSSSGSPCPATTSLRIAAASPSPRPLRSSSAS